MYVLAMHRSITTNTGGARRLRLRDFRGPAGERAHRCRVSAKPVTRSPIEMRELRLKRLREATSVASGNAPRHIGSQSQIIGHYASLNAAGGLTTSRSWASLSRMTRRDRIQQGATRGNGVRRVRRRVLGRGGPGRHEYRAALTWVAGSVPRRVGHPRLGGCPTRLSVAGEGYLTDGQ